MKTCPVCKAQCFDDMETCYGCLHSFADGEGKPIVAEPAIEPQEAPDSEAKEVIVAADDAVKVSIFTGGGGSLGGRRVTVEIGFPLEESEFTHVCA